MKAKEYVAPGKYNVVEIPNGSWAVIIDEQEDTTDQDEWSYLHPSLNVDTSFIGPYPNRVLLNETRSSDCINRRVLYWHEQPFAVIEYWESPMDGQWVHLACEVSAHGLTKSLPKFKEPRYIFSRAGKFDLEGRLNKWYQLSELGALIGISPAELLVRHRHHHDGYDKGLIMIRADSWMEASETVRYELFNTGNNATFDPLTASDPSTIWLRRRFVLVALYLHMLGYENLTHTRA